jgi:hypothetical protein
LDATAVISPEGKVLAVWIGAWTGRNQTEVENYFHLRLPGLKELNASSTAKSSQIQPAQ